MTARLSIIIVSWNVKDDLLRCVASLRDNPPPDPVEQIVVDNASADATVEALRRQYPEVAVIANAENVGFAAACNQGIARAQGDYILLLNPDTIVHPHALDEMAAFLDANPGVGACGPKLLNEDGSVQGSVRRFPTFGAVLYSHTVCRVLGLFRRQHRRWMMKDFTFDQQADVDQLMGAAMMVRRSVIDEVGPLDVDFFMYFEDVDWCYRIKEAGWRIVFVPEAVITHLGGRSSVQAPFRRIMMLRSLLAFFRKHRRRLPMFLFTAAFKFALVVRNVCHLVIGFLAYVFACLVPDRNRKSSARKKIILHAQLLSRHLWHVLSM
ncbi:MAG: glycosyltransferase family 2 protein [Phycisphaerae bacterium]|nr:glycosyltransferase family 2 protein [Phycisphaerae bacterium]